MLFRSEEPCPISIIAMTAAMPMTIPRQVNADRILWRLKACSAIRNVRRNDLIRASVLTAESPAIAPDGILLTTVVSNSHDFTMFRPVAEGIFPCLGRGAPNRAFRDIPRPIHLRAFRIDWVARRTFR